MGLVRKFAVQGHAVPNGYQRALGPFPAEIFAPNPRAENLEHGDSLHEALDDVRYFRCKECNEILTEHELDAHVCEEEY